MKNTDNDQAKPSHRRRNATIGVLLIMVAATSAFFIGGYVATGNWNPWGNRHYYEKLNVNFGYCVTPHGGTTTCDSVHNVVFDSGMGWLDQAIQGTSGSVTNGCLPSATCGMSFISLSNSAVTFAHGDATYGSTNGDCSKQEGGSELAANGLSRAAGTITLFPYTGTSGGTSTIVKTFTATATQAVQAACLVSFASAASANNIELAAASFTQVTLNNQDTIQITWTLTWTYS